MAEPIPPLGSKVRNRLIAKSQRIRFAFLLEAIGATHANSSKAFIRTQEGSEEDGAVIINIRNTLNIPENPTDRYQWFTARYRGK